jgi:hypothetical protein
LRLAGTVQGFGSYQSSKESLMQSAFIFITFETIATLAILSALYRLARDRKPVSADIL